MEAMLEIKNVINTFSMSLERAIQAEVRRQMLAQLDAAMKEMPAAPAPVEVVKRGPKEGSKAQAKPCPVTGVLNTHRRFSYLMPEVRTPENLAKFKRGGK